MKNTFTNFLTLVITLLVFGLWILPAFMQYHGGAGVWGIAYLPICILTALWGVVLYKSYYES